MGFPTDRFGRRVCVLVSDDHGAPIAGARVQSEWDDIQVTNFDGLACLYVQSGTLALTQVQATAMGYEPHSQTLNTFDRTAEVVLQRKGDLPSQNTISARELEPGARKQGVALEKQAIERMHKGDLEEAERLFRSALDIFPSSALIRNNLGIICLRQNEFDQAANWFEEAFNMAPRDPLVLTNLGLIRWAQEKYDESYMLLSRAAEHGYSTPKVRYAMGIVALCRGKASLAVKHLSAVSSKRFPYRTLFLAVGYELLGKKHDASGSFAHFLEKKPAPFHFAPLRAELDNS